MHAHFRENARFIKVRKNQSGSRLCAGLNLMSTTGSTKASRFQTNKRAQRNFISPLRQKKASLPITTRRKHALSEAQTRRFIGRTHEKENETAPDQAFLRRRHRQPDGNPHALRNESPSLLQLAAEQKSQGGRETNRPSLPPSSFL